MRSRMTGYTTVSSAAECITTWRGVRCVCVFGGVQCVLGAQRSQRAAQEARKTRQPKHRRPRTSRMDGIACAMFLYNVRAAHKTHNTNKHTPAHLPDDGVGEHLLLLPAGVRHLGGSGGGGRQGSARALCISHTCQHCVGACTAKQRSIIQVGSAAGAPPASPLAAPGTACRAHAPGGGGGGCVS